MTVESNTDNKSVQNLGVMLVVVFMLSIVSYASYLEVTNVEPYKHEASMDEIVKNILQLEVLAEQKQDTVHPDLMDVFNKQKIMSYVYARNTYAAHISVKYNVPTNHTQHTLFIDADCINPEILEEIDVERMGTLQFLSITCNDGTYGEQ